MYNLLPYAPPVTEYKSKMQNVKKVSNKSQKEDQEASHKKNVKV